MKVWIRRGAGAFVRCPNESKARRRAKHWHRTGQGDQGLKHPVISMFVGGFSKAHRTELYAS